MKALDHPVYHQRVKLRLYNCHTDVFQASNPRDAARILRRLKPDWTRDEHLELSQRHGEAAILQSKRYAELLDVAAQATFGRRFEFTDYKISAIGSEEFSEPHKVALRFTSRAATNHRTLARAHAAAAHRAPKAVPPAP